MIGFFAKPGKASGSWVFEKQFLVAFSTCEAKYCAKTDAARDILWMRRKMQESSYDMAHGTLPMSDSHFGQKYQSSSSLYWWLCKKQNDQFQVCSSRANSRKYFNETNKIMCSSSPNSVLVLAKRARRSEKTKLEPLNSPGHRNVEWVNVFTDYSHLCNIHNVNYWNEFWHKLCEVEWYAVQYSSWHSGHFLEND